MADQSKTFNGLISDQVAHEAAKKGITVEQYRAEIIASNAAHNAAADAYRAKSRAAWDALSPEEKAKWGGYPNAMLTADETYED